jgi:hypothetical protein
MINCATHVKKRAMQRELFPDLKVKTVYTLAGLDIVNYTELYPRTIEKIHSYEQDEGTFALQQVSDLDDRVTLQLGSIITAPIDIRAFYNLDFCCTIDKAFETIRKFRNCQFMVTVDMRTKGGAERTKSGFFEAVGEEIQSQIGNIIITDKNKYKYQNYYSGTDFKKGSNMSTFFKIKSKN